MLFLKKVYAYYFWNLKGVRVVPQSYCSIKADLKNCLIFGASKVYDEACIMSDSYITDSTIQHAEIGSFCSVAPGCKIGLEEHNIENYSTHPSTYDFNEYVRSKGKVKIGNHVWIGTNVVILQGVVIGNHAVVAAGAVVIKNIPEYEIWGGVPAKFIMKRNVK